MSQALFTSMTGLNTAQQSISVVSNNVANINTTAYKSADARFATLFSNTLTAGNAPTATAGGTNPKQIGLGVKLAGITRNFDTSSFLSTGVSGDSMISGKGYYTVMDANGGIFLTRDGSFSLDADGNMITANGLKVLGAAGLKNEESSTTPVHVPQTFTRVLNGDANLADRTLGELNNGSFTEGTLKIEIHGLKDGKDVSDTIEVTIGEGKDIEMGPGTKYSTFVESLTNAINGKINTALYDTGNVPHFDTPVTTDGKTTFALTDADTSFQILDTSTTNVAECFGFYKGTDTAPATSKVMSYTVDVNPTSSPSNMTSLSSYSIGADGTIEATYDNGDKLTVYLDDKKDFQYQYVTATGVYIMGSDGTATQPSAVQINPLLCTQSSLVMQIATVVNDAGLVSQANNLWTPGPDSGKLTFTIAGQMGTGDIQTGGLESSNVDLARELSNMIIAQRAINANSRVFGTASSILETLSQLGR